MAPRLCPSCGRPTGTAYCSTCGTLQPVAAAPGAPGVRDAPSASSASADPLDAPDFLGVSEWEIERPRQPRSGGSNAAVLTIAAVAVVAVIVAVALALGNRGSQSATPSDLSASSIVTTLPTASAASASTELSGGSAAPAASAVPGVSAALAAPGVSAAPAAPTEQSSASLAPPVTATATSDAAISAVTATGSPAEFPAAGPTATASAQSPTPSPSEPTTAPPPTTAPAAVVQEIACAPGFIVQVASGVDDASVPARVAELRAAGQLPPDTKVAHTASSCSIFPSQTNTIVLYTGPYAAPYDGCAARLGSAPDSFVKGTTPETATQYVSCLCPADVTHVPAVTAIGQNGVWIGELQRVLANKLGLEIANLEWGTFTEQTSAAVRKFQHDKDLLTTGLVDAGTWQALQGAAC